MKQNNKHDFGCLRYTKSIPNSKGWHFELIFQYSLDNNVSYIEIYSRWKEPNVIIHVYYSQDYTKSNLRDAREYFNFLYSSYRERLELSKKF